MEQLLRLWALENRWDDAATMRLTASGEETLSILMQVEDEVTAGVPRRLSVSVRLEDGAAQVEFVTVLESGLCAIF